MFSVTDQKEKFQGTLLQEKKMIVFTLFKFQLKKSYRVAGNISVFDQ